LRSFDDGVLTLISDFDLASVETGCLISFDFKSFEDGDLNFAREPTFVVISPFDVDLTKGIVALVAVENKQTHWSSLLWNKNKRNLLVEVLEPDPETFICASCV